MAPASDMKIEVTGEKDIVMTRTFNAPRELVFRAYTEVEHIKNWWGMRGSTLTTCEMDSGAPGRWRYVSREADGSEYAFSGEIREFVPPSRLVMTFVFEPMPDHYSVDTYEFEDLGDGRTKLTASSTFDSLEALQGMLASGMEEGATVTWDRLEELLATLS